MEFIDLGRQYRALKRKIDGRIAKVLERAQFINGDEVRELAENLAAYCSRKYCLTCANGTDALTLALRCFDVGKGDAVFVPDLTFFASAETVALAGGTCVFVDVDERTFNLDAEKLEKRIQQVIAEKKLKPKAIVAVDLFGLPANFPVIRKVADKYGLPIIEDAAQGFGGSIDGKRACSFGDISTTSFFPAKPLGCYGDGGAVFTDCEDYYKLMVSLAFHGKGSHKYDNVRIGYNSRLDTVQAAILLEKLKAFSDYELTDRNKIAKKYDSYLKDRFTTPLIPEHFGSSWAQYTLILEDEKERDDLQKHLNENGIPTMIYYPIPMHALKAFEGIDTPLGEVEVATRLTKTVLSVPMHPYLKDEEIEFISSKVLETR